MSRPHPHDSGSKDEKASLSLSNSILSNKIIFIISMIVVIALIADASLARTSDLLSPILGRKSATTLTIFTLISIAYFIGQFMILLFVRNRIKKIHSRANLQFYRTYKVTMAVQIALSIILLSVILQLVTMSYYFILALIATITISYGLAIVMMALLMKSFLSWSRTSKNFVILAYGVSAATLAIHLGFTLFFAATALLGVPAEVRTPVSHTPFFMPGSVSSILYNMHNLTSILSFSILWGTTVLLLHHYSQKVGRLKYWIIVTLPLVYFLSQFPTLFLNVFDPIIRENPILFGSLLTFIFTLSKPVGGILFGIAFWRISRDIPHTIIVRDYLMISALGFVLLFTSDQAIVLINAAYPPFGVAAVSFIGLSSYLIFVGIYYSAISISHDSRVRREIKKFAVKESKLLDSIGSAQLEKDIAEKITAIKQMQNSDSQSLGIPLSIDEEGVKKYLEDVLHEKKKRDDKKEDK
jgi:MFS family permease